MRTKRISIGGDTKTKKQRTLTGTKKFRRILVRKEEDDELNDYQQQSSSRRKTCQIIQNQGSSTLLLNETLVANNRELANALEEAQIDAQNARQKALDIQKQRHAERQALMTKINSLQQDLQVATKRYGSEFEMKLQAQERFSEVHKLLQETIKLLLESSNRLTTAMMLVSNSSSNTTETIQAQTPMVAMDTPMVAMDTPIPPSSTCDNTPPPDFQVDVTAIESTQTQTFDSIISSSLTPLKTCESAFPPDAPTIVAAVRELGGLSKDVEAHHTVENPSDKKSKSLRRRTRVMKDKYLVEKQQDCTVSKVNNKYEEPMDTSEMPPHISNIEETAQNRDKLPIKEAHGQNFASKETVISHTAVPCSESYGEKTLIAEPFRKTSEGREGTSTYKAGGFPNLECQKPINGSGRAESDIQLSDVESASPKSHVQRRKSVRPEPYKTAQSRRRSQRLSEIQNAAHVNKINTQVNTSINSSFVTEAMTELSNKRQIYETKWDIIQPAETYDKGGVAMAAGYKEVDESSQQRPFYKHRRSSHGVCYTEPTLRRKLRQGDPFTDSSLYTSLPGSKKTRKSTPFRVPKCKSHRSVLTDLTNVSIVEEDESIILQ